MNQTELKETLGDMGYDDVLLFDNYDYATAFIGVSSDGRAIYDYDLMVEYLINEGMSEQDAIEWIDYNTLRALPYFGQDAPIVIYSLKSMLI